MKALRIKAFQETACYTKPFANKVTETYPLPPYSTVKGMIHAVMGAEELIPFSLSIQGDYETIIVDYRKTYLFKNKKFNMPIILDGLAIETPTFENMTSMPLYSHMLYRVELIIHVSAEANVLNKLYEEFHCIDTHLSLGRQEDLLRLDDVSIVDLEEIPYEGALMKHAMYIPTNKVVEEERENGIPYHLNWTYKIKKGVREWNKIPTLYFTKGRLVDDDFINNKAFIDPDQYVVIWNN